MPMSPATSQRSPDALTGCDTMVALGNSTASGQTLFAKNSDRAPEECQPLVQVKRANHRPESTVSCQFLKIPQVGITYGHVGSRPYWCWGYEHGFNEHQVVIGNEALRSKLPAADEPKLTGMDLIRLGLERGGTAAEAVWVITTMITAFGQGRFAGNASASDYDNGLIVADPTEAYIIETAGHEWAVKRVKSALGISNVHSVGTDWGSLSPSAQRAAVERGWWRDDEGQFDFARAYADFPAEAIGRGPQRRARSCTLLAGRNGKVDLHTMMTAVCDHSDGEEPAEPFRTEMPTTRAICMHHGPNSSSNTAATLVADLCSDGLRLPVYWCSFYSPCLGVFLPMFAEGELPAVLAEGGQEPSRESPWWLFRELARKTRLGDGFDEAAVAALRSEWAEMQLELTESAYQMAAEGRDLIGRGKVNRASKMLTKYMRANTERAVKKARELVSRGVPAGVPG